MRVTIIVLVLDLVTRAVLCGIVQHRVRAKCSSMTAVNRFSMTKLVPQKKSTKKKLMGQPVLASHIVSVLVMLPPVAN